MTAEKKSESKSFEYIFFKHVREYHKTELSHNAEIIKHVHYLYFLLRLYCQRANLPVTQQLLTDASKLTMNKIPQFWCITHSYITPIGTAIKRKQQQLKINANNVCISLNIFSNSVDTSIVLNTCSM